MALETDEQKIFRQHCREWLQNNIPPPPTVRLPQQAIGIMEREQLEYLQALAEVGL